MGDEYSLIAFSKVTLPPWEETLAVCLLCQSKWPLETECRLSPGVLPSNFFLHIYVFFTYCLLKQPANGFFLNFTFMDWEVSVFKGSAWGGTVSATCAEPSCPEQSCVGWDLCGLQTLERRDFISFWVTCRRWKTVTVPKAASVLTSDVFICSNYSYSFFLHFFFNSTI